MTKWLNEQEQRAWRSYLEATLLIFDALDRQSQADAGMPHAYYEILVHLSEAESRELRMSELAARTRSSRSRLSHAVARLEERGWVERRDCLEDRRGQLCHLTDAGLEILRSVAPGHVETVRQRVFDQLSEEQVEQMDKIGRAIVEGFEDTGTRAQWGRSSARSIGAR